MSDMTSTKKPLLSNDQYNTVKFLVTIVLPAIATLYFALSAIWDLPKAEEVVGTIAVITTFLGTLLGLSSQRYNNSPDAHEGYLTSTGVDADTGMPQLKMVLTKLPDEILSNDTVRLKVGPPPPAPVES